MCRRQKPVSSRGLCVRHRQKTVPVLLVMVLVHSAVDNTLVEFVNGTGKLLVACCREHLLMIWCLFALFLQVLKKLSFLSDLGIIELKGRVACELHTQEVLVTELLFRNALSGMEPAEIAALLSSVVFQQVRTYVRMYSSCFDL